MSVSSKYTYLWTILCGIPFGIGMLIGAYETFKDIENSVENLPRISGYITEYGEKQYYNKNIDTSYDVFFIQIGEKILIEENLKQKELLRKNIPIAYKHKRKINIWLEKRTSNIEQIAIENFILYRYKPPYWMPITFLIIGLIFTIMGTIYSIKYYNSTWKTKRI